MQRIADDSTAPLPPIATIVVVADHGSTLAHTHTDLRSCFAGLAAQDCQDSVEILLVESTECVPHLPPELLAILPSARVLAVDSRQSYDLKNVGVSAARADVVLLLDADCTPSPAWLRSAVAYLRAHPKVLAIRGRTVYPDSGLVSRILALLSRAHSDCDQVAETRFLSNANGAYRRDVYLRFPLRADAGPFSGLLQSESMWRLGYRPHFVPAMEVVHAFEGWPMERDIRHQIGHATIFVRRLDPNMRYAWLLRLGIASIPLFLVGRILDSSWNVLLSARTYNIRWWQIPVALMLAAAVHLLELPGMIRAFRQQPAGATDYR